MGILDYAKGIGAAILGRSSSGASARRSSAADAARRLSYHSGINNRNRDRVTPDERMEDFLYDERREIHVERSRRQLRNFSVLSWMIDKHLDFNSTFDIQFKTGDDHLDDWLTELLAWWSEAENFDVGRRYSLFNYLRVNDAQKVIAGDMGTLKFEDGRVMAVLSDQIDRPASGVTTEAGWFRGVKLHPVTWEPMRYSIRLRDLRNGGYSRNCIEVPAYELYHDAVRKHYPNLIYGISPLTTAINSIQDSYEGINWHLVKMKVAAMLGVVTFEKGNALPQLQYNPETGEPVPDTGKRKYKVDLGDGILGLSMDVDERIEFLDSRTPSTETQAFFEVVTLVALKALNIPYSFFREDFTNFYGSRGGLLHYLRSCVEPRQLNIQWLNHHIKWRVVKWIVDGYVKLPKGYPLRNLRWQCVPRGFPWWDPSKEIDGMIKAIQAGLMTPQESCMQIGTNYYENIEQTKEALDWAKRHDLNPIWAQALMPVEIPPETEADKAEREKKGGNNGKQQSENAGTQTFARV